MLNEMQKKNKNLRISEKKYDAPKCFFTINAEMPSYPTEQKLDPLGEKPQLVVLGRD
jgi:hypothetical protein